METGTPLWPFVLYTILVLLLVVAMLGIPYLLGERHSEHATDTPYESGMLPTGSARVRFPSEFYLVAMLFVLFDLETVFIATWAVAMRPLGWGGYAAILVFIGTLLIALGYLWRNGALEWGTSARQHTATGQGVDDEALTE